MTVTSLFLTTTAIFVVLSKHIRKTAVLFFLRAKIAAIFTVYIGPRENDDKEYLFFLTSPGSASLLKGYHKLVLVLVALDEKRNSGLCGLLMGLVKTGVSGELTSQMTSRAKGRYMELLSELLM